MPHAGAGPPAGVCFDLPVFVISLQPCHLCGPITLRMGLSRVCRAQQREKGEGLAGWVGDAPTLPSQVGLKTWALLAVQWGLTVGPLGPHEGSKDSPTSSVGPCPPRDKNGS